MITCLINLITLKFWVSWYKWTIQSFLIRFQLSLYLFFHCRDRDPVQCDPHPRAQRHGPNHPLYPQLWDCSWRGAARDTESATAQRQYQLPSEAEFVQAEFHLQAELHFVITHEIQSSSSVHTSHRIEPAKSDHIAEKCDSTHRIATHHITQIKFRKGSYASLNDAVQCIEMCIYSAESCMLDVESFARFNLEQITLWNKKIVIQTQ